MGLCYSLVGTPKLEVPVIVVMIRSFRFERRTSNVTQGQGQRPATMAGVLLIVVVTSVLVLTLMVLRQLSEVILTVVLMIVVLGPVADDVLERGRCDQHICLQYLLVDRSLLTKRTGELFSLDVPGGEYVI